MINERVLFWTVLVVDVLLCIFIIVINLTLILTVVCCRKARSRTRNAMLVSTCVADLVVGAFTQPLYMNTYITRSMYHSCELHVAVQLVGDYTQDFVCFWTLVTVAGGYIWRLGGDRWGWRTSLPGHYSVLPSSGQPRSSLARARPYRRFCHVTKKVLVVCWPWLAALLVPLPVVLMSVDEHTRSNYWQDTFCPLHIVFPARIAVLIIVFYLPVGVIAMQAAGVGLVCYLDMLSARPHARPGRSRHQQDVPCSSTATAAACAPRAAGSEEGRGEAGSAGSPELAADGVGDGPRVSLLPPSGSDHHGDGRPREAVTDGGEGIDHDVITTAAAGTSAITTTSDGSVVVVAELPSATLSPSPRREEAEEVERPMHMLVPLLVTLVCELPLMVCWWFYERMRMDVVILVDVSLHRLYLLRAALLPLAWFVLPDLRHALGALRYRLLDACVACGCLGAATSPRGEQGDFSVAYSTLHETGDAPLAPDGAGGAADGRRPAASHRPGGGVTC